MGRRALIKDNAMIIINSHGASCKLQRRSERRAIVDAILDAGGAMPMSNINSIFGYDCRTKVLGLVKTGWLQILEEEPA